MQSQAFCIRKLFAPLVIGRVSSSGWLFSELARFLSKHTTLTQLPARKVVGNDVDVVVLVVVCASVVVAGTSQTHVEAEVRQVLGSRRRRAVYRA